MLQKCCACAHRNLNLLLRQVHDLNISCQASPVKLFALDPQRRSLSNMLNCSTGQTVSSRIQPTQ